LILAYILKRLGLALLTLLIILFVSYTLLRLAPGDPTQSDMLAGETGTLGENDGTLRKNNAMREKLDLDKPIVTGFVIWLKKAVIHGDFGESAAVEPGRKVTAMIAEKLPLTVMLNCWAIMLTCSCAILIGVTSAAKVNSVYDRAMEILLFTLYSLPVMWVGLLLQALFCEAL
jgi:peptide/nickel transport system permease protein